MVFILSTVIGPAPKHGWDNSRLQFISIMKIWIISSWSWQCHHFLSGNIYWQCASNTSFSRCVCCVISVWKIVENLILLWLRNFAPKFRSANCACEKIILNNFHKYFIQKKSLNLRNENSIFELIFLWRTNFLPFFLETWWHFARQENENLKKNIYFS